MSRRETGPSPARAAALRKQVEATREPVRPSILDEAAAMTASRRWAFTVEQLADIAEVRAAVAAGKLPRVGAERLARILKSRYDLPWSVATIRDRIRSTP